MCYCHFCGRPKKAKDNPLGIGHAECEQKAAEAAQDEYMIKMLSTLNSWARPFTFRGTTYLETE